MYINPSYLLIVACSQRKCSEAGLLPALERYDGGSYKVLRKAQREGNWPKGLDVLILSAHYGLIEASTPIAYYDRRMTRERAKELQEQVLQRLQAYTHQKTYLEVYVDLGQDYRSALGNLEQIFIGSSVIYAQGPIGERLAKLKQWLVTTCQKNHLFREPSL